MGTKVARKRKTPIRKRSAATATSGKRRLTRWKVDAPETKPAGSRGTTSAKSRRAGNGSTACVCGEVQLGAPGAIHSILTKTKELKKDQLEQLRKQLRDQRRTIESLRDQNQQLSQMLGRIRGIVTEGENTHLTTEAIVLNLVAHAAPGVQLVVGGVQ